MRKYFSQFSSTRMWQTEKVFETRQSIIIRSRRKNFKLKFCWIIFCWLEKFSWNYKLLKWAKKFESSPKKIFEFTPPPPDMMRMSDEVKRKISSSHKSFLSIFHSSWDLLTLHNLFPLQTRNRDFHSFRWT